MINELLKKLNFSDKEIDVYLTVLKNGKIIPADLARITGIKRSTVYGIAADLKKIGVIAEDLSGPIKYLLACPPVDLKNILTKEKDALVKKERYVTEAVAELKQLSADTRYTVPKIRFITEDELEGFLYKQVEVWNDSMEKTGSKWVGLQDHTFAKCYEEWIDWYWAMAPEKQKLQLFTNKSEIEKVIEKKKYSRRQMKNLPKKKTFSTTTWVCGDYIINIFTNSRPYYAVEIRNSELAKNQRDLFEIMWEML